MEVGAAYSLISHAIDRGRCAHGYLVVGDISEGMKLVDMVLAKLYPGAAGQLASRSHPDVAYLESEGKGRIIPVKAMRELIVEPMQSTSFSGGWKVGVIVGADRMRREAANAFLKTLEEPAPKTLFLMLTDSPDSMLPTVVSRSQRVDLPLSEGILEGDDYEEVADAFAAKDARRLAEKLSSFKQEEDEVAQQLRKAFFKTIMSFARKMMVSGRLPAFRAYRNIEAVEDAYRQTERSINDEAVVSFMLDRIVLP
jgi:DNA polymerase-3 subunit delta'